jgi:hypothetical protein
MTDGGEANSRLMVRNRSPSARLEEATVYSTMDEKTLNGSLISSIAREIFASGRGSANISLDLEIASLLTSGLASVRWSLTTV